MAKKMRYSSYKDSEFEWLGEIPSEWPLLLVSQTVTQVKNKNSDLEEQNLLSLSYGKIKRKPIDTNGGLLPASFDGYNIIEANDIVLRLTDLQNDHTSLRVGLSNERGIITSAYITMRPRVTESAKYLYYILHTFDIRKGFYGMGSGVRQGLNYDEVRRLRIPYPSIMEQQAIAAYLDSKTAHIDVLIEEAKSSIEEYKQWKASIIYEAVTKGLDPDAELVDSGVEWIGKMPKGWTCTALKNLCSMQSGRNITSEQIADEGEYPVYGGNGIRGYYSEWNTEGDFLTVGRQGALCGNVHKVSGRVWATEHAVVTRVKDNMSLPYLYYNLVAMNLNQYASNTAAQPGLAVGVILTKQTVFPPIEEQQAIGTYLDNKCSAIDALIGEKELLITDLDAYKKSLIFEVVTGKRKVV